jgi:hypothetical protein
MLEATIDRTHIKLSFTHFVFDSISPNFYWLKYINTDDLILLIYP